MKVYQVKTYANRRFHGTSKFFTSKAKALGYVIGLYEDTNYRAIEKMPSGDWWNARWCHDTNKIFSVKNCLRYEYVFSKNGADIATIEEVEVM